MRIGQVDLDKEVLVVAEIGNNHEGNVDVARELVRKAAECGVGAVKFQTFRTEHFVGHSDSTRFNRLKSFELSYPQFDDLARLARSLGLLFLSTPLDLESARFLASRVDAFKIASGDNNFDPLLACVAQTGKPILVSSGVSDLQQITRSVAFVRRHWPPERPVQLGVLHCVSSYPAPAEQANLRAISVLGDHLRIPIGYSDHTIGLDAAVLAVGVGARVIEKHFTLDKAFSDFRDHQLSADPAEMRDLVQRVRVAVAMLGDGIKRVQPCEQAMVSIVRRSIVAAADLPEGHRLGDTDLTWLRPAGGLAPGEEHVLLGKRLRRSVASGAQLSAADVE